MAVEWFDRHPDGSDLAQSQDDPSMLLLNMGCPEVIRVPAETGYGGVYRCLAVEVGPCPAEGHGEQCRHYILDGPVSVAECTVDRKFIWYR